MHFIHLLKPSTAFDNGQAQADKVRECCIFFAKVHDWSRLGWLRAPNARMNAPHLSFFFLSPQSHPCERGTEYLPTSFCPASGFFRPIASYKTSLSSSSHFISSSPTKNILLLSCETTSLLVYRQIYLTDKHQPCSSNTYLTVSAYHALLQLID